MSPELIGFSVSVSLKFRAKSVANPGKLVVSGVSQLVRVTLKLYLVWKGSVLDQLKDNSTEKIINFPNSLSSLVALFRTPLSQGRRTALSRFDRDRTEIGLVKLFFCC